MITPTQSLPSGLFNAMKLDSIPLYRGAYVYFLCAGEEVVYVGQTATLFARLAAHLKEKQFDSVYFMEVEKSARLQTERLFIERLKPRLNGTSTSASSGYTNSGTTNLVKSTASGVFYVRATVGGKKVFKSTKTKCLETAKARLTRILQDARNLVKDEESQ